MSLSVNIRTVQKMIVLGSQCFKYLALFYAQSSHKKVFVYNS